MSAPATLLRGFLAAGTALMLYNGDTVEVQHLAPGMQLMGDDCTPRTVAAAFSTGHTAMVALTPSKESGRSVLTVSAAHRLSARCHDKPSVGKASGQRAKPHTVSHAVCTAAGKLVRATAYFATLPEAEAHKATLLAAAPLLRWEGTVAEYRAIVNKRLQSILKLRQPGLITYPPPLVPFAAVVRAAMVNAAGEPLIAPDNLQVFVKFTAWMLGLWLADGAADRQWISQGGPVVPASGHHQEVMNEILQWGADARLDVEQAFDRYSSAGNPVYWFKLPRQFREILKAYDLLGDKHIPLALLTEQVEVRKNLLAGIIDGDGYLSAKKTYELPAKQLHMAEQYRQLARSLGYRVGRISGRVTMVDHATGQTFRGHRLYLSGNQLDDLNPYLRISYKHCPQPTPNCDSNCWGFKAADAGVATSYGFTLAGGKQQVLMADFTVIQVA